MQANPASTPTSTPDAAIAVRPLAADDLDAVVRIDAGAAGRTRREYVERRLRAARREPGAHAQFGAVDADGLAGFILARVLVGEFGRVRPALRLELVGVRADRRGSGVGRRLLEALAAWGERHGVAELRTAASWRDTRMLGWFDALGWSLAPDRIVERAVDGGGTEGWEDDTVAPGDAAASGEVDYGRPECNDHERLARDRVDVRSMTGPDVDAIVRIDRTITGHDRRDYIAARLAESLDDAAIRVSLAARCDGAVVGYLMARADLGDYGRTEPVAVVDTLGVDPEYAHRGIGQAMLSQLLANLGALRVERVETVVPRDDLALLGFLQSAGFAPGQRLPFVRPCDPAQAGAGR